MDGGFVLRKVRSLKQWLLHGLLVAKNAAGGLVVKESGELEEKGIIDGWLGFLVRLVNVSTPIPI